MSLEPNAILFTNGNEDTYPCWIQQEVKNIRNDVTILNIDLLQNQHYRNKIYDKTGLKKTSTSVYELINQTTLNNPNKPIYIGLTVNPIVHKDLKNQLYITGLAFKYSKKTFNNVEQLVSNWEFRFKTDELIKKGF